jgi:hypothetical protein
MQTPDSTPEPTCEKCRAHGRVEIDETARLRVEVLTKYDQVITKLGSPVQTDVTHAISALGLRFHYRIERPIRCALPDRTNHNEGLIVETACGLVLNIGHVCGDKWIFGLSKLVEMRTRTDAYDSDIRTIDHNPAELRAELGELEQAETHLHAARGGLVDFVRPVSRYMRDATTNAKLLEVLIDVQEKGLDGCSTVASHKPYRDALVHASYDRLHLVARRFGGAAEAQAPVRVAIEHAVEKANMVVAHDAVEHSPRWAPGAIRRCEGSHGARNAERVPTIW